MAPNGKKRMTVHSEPDAKRQRMHRFEGCYREVFPAFAAFVHQRGGQLDDARDIFQEALLVYYEQVLRHQEAVNHNYLFGICRHLWHRKSRHATRQTAELAPEDIPDPEPFYEEPSTNKLQALLSRVGERCMELLTLFYYHNQTMQQIAHTFGFSGERSATVQKYKCLEKVRDHVHTQKMIYEDFLA